MPTTICSVYLSDRTVKVSFNSKVDKGLRIQQLSRGQRSLVALALGAFQVNLCVRGHRHSDFGYCQLQHLILTQIYYPVNPRLTIYLIFGPRPDFDRYA